MSITNIFDRALGQSLLNSVLVSEKMPKLKHSAALIQSEVKQIETLSVFGEERHPWVTSRETNLLMYGFEGLFIGCKNL